MKLRALTGAALSAFLVPIGVALPSASAASGSADYSCTFSNSWNRNGQVGVNVALAPTGAVQAGSSVTLDGTVTVTIPNKLRDEISLVAKNATLSSFTLSLDAEAGESQKVVQVASGSNRQPIDKSRTLAYSYNVTLSGVAVPSGATGTLDVSVKPGFTGLLELDRIGINRKASCSLPSGANARVLSIPITEAAETPSPDPGGSTDGPGDGTGVPGGDTGGSTGGSTGGDTGGDTGSEPGGLGSFPGISPGTSTTMPGFTFTPPNSSEPGVRFALPGNPATPGRSSVLPVGPDGESPIPLAPGTSDDSSEDVTSYAALPPQTDRSSASLPTQIVVGIIALVILGGLGVLLPARLNMLRVREEVA